MPRNEGVDVRVALPPKHVWVLLLLYKAETDKLRVDFHVHLIPFGLAQDLKHCHLGKLLLAIESFRVVSELHIATTTFHPLDHGSSNNPWGRDHVATIIECAHLGSRSWRRHAPQHVLTCHVLARANPKLLSELQGVTITQRSPSRGRPWR